MRLTTATLLLAFVALFTACDKGDTIVLPDPGDPQPDTSPLVTVIYEPGALGDQTYNDLIYQGVEEAAQLYGLRTMQLSPQTVDEGLAYLELLFRQFSEPADSIRRLIIVATATYDEFLRKNNRRLEGNAFTDLLYLETSTPLDGKGSTLYLPYYGAMYEAAAICPIISTNTLLIGSNPCDEAVGEAVKGFQDGYAMNYVDVFGSATDKQLSTVYIGDAPGQGYNIADSTVLKLIIGRPTPLLLVPVCGGASTKFRRMADIFGYSYMYMGIDQATTSEHSFLSAVKHIDRAVTQTIGQWLSAEGMAKHQKLGLSTGYTEVVTHPTDDFMKILLDELYTDSLQAVIHDDAIRKEAEYEQ